ncbi:MAG TPA: hypothetical protein VGE51_16000 [Fontimonas sp.]
MKSSTAGPTARSTRVGAAAGNPAYRASLGFQGFQGQLWVIGLSLFVLIAIAIALLAWRAGHHLPNGPLAAVLFWSTVFSLLLVSLLALIRLLPLLPRFQRLNRACAARRLYRWRPRLASLLVRNEHLVGATYAPCFDPHGRGHGWISALLVWTTQRLLLVPASAAPPAQPIWSLRLSEIALIRVRPLGGGWLRWLKGPIEQIEIIEEAGLRTCIVVGVPSDSDAIAGELIRTATRDPR